MAASGPTATFSLNILGFLALLWALLAWRRPVPPRSDLPAERFLSAMRAGLRFATAVPIMRAAILRACAFFFFAAALWAFLPLVVRQGLGLGPTAFGLMLGASGGGAVVAGLALPLLRDRLSPGRLVLSASLLAYAAMALLSISRHWVPAAFAVVLFGAAWLTAGTPWVRSRS
jgi:predicted MFS family arabinose efflux permease